MGLTLEQVAEALDLDIEVVILSPVRIASEYVTDN